MTPKQWLAATKPEIMFPTAAECGQVRDHNRRLRLFGCACVRQVWHLLPTNARSAIFVSERFAEGAATATDLRAAAIRLPSLEVTAAQTALAAAGWASGVRPSDARQQNPNEQLRYEPPTAARLSARAVATKAIGQAPTPHSHPMEGWHVAWTNAYDKARATQADYLRDLFPPPKYVAKLDPQWLTSTVVALVRQMHESGDFSAVPILADALQDAGCDDETALRCCRTPGNVHVRGNWVVDLLMDRL